MRALGREKKGGGKEKRDGERTLGRREKNNDQQKMPHRGWGAATGVVKLKMKNGLGRGGGLE